MIDSNESADDLATVGARIFREQIEPTLGPDAHGRFVVIDVESGDYEIADSDIEATQRLAQGRPSRRFFGVRVGHRAAYRFGSGMISSGQ